MVYSDLFRIDSLNFLLIKTYPPMTKSSPITKTSLLSLIIPYEMATIPIRHRQTMRVFSFIVFAQFSIDQLSLKGELKIF